MKARGHQSGGSRQPVLARLPVIEVTSRRQMARVLRQWRWLFDATAHNHLGDTPEAQEAVNAVFSRVLADEEPQEPHALRRVMQLLHRECYRIQRVRERQPSVAEQWRAKGVPYDDVLELPVTDEVLEAVRALREPERQTFMLAAKGLSRADIAMALGANENTTGMRLYRTRRRLRRLSLPGLAVLIPALRSAWRQMRHGAVPRLADALAPFSAQVASVAALAAVVLTVGSVRPVLVPSAAAGPSAVGDPATGALSQATGPGVVDAPVMTMTATPGILHAAVLPTAQRVPTRPDETRLVAVTPAPDYEHNRTVVALGEGPVCHCLVLFQSTDGAASWRAAPGPPAGAQIALPPDYPRDPQIFIGNPSTLGRSSDYVADYFGAPFRALGVPPGFLALSGAFDRGDRHLYAATAVGVISVDMTTGTPAVGVVSTGLWGVASLVSRPDGAGVLALVPPRSLNAPTSDQALSDGAITSSSSALLGCRRGVCSRLASTGSSLAGTLTLSATYAVDHLVAAWGGTALTLSSDGGQSFHAVALPPGATAVRSVALAGGRVWLETARTPSAGTQLYWSPAVGGVNWRAVAEPSVQPGAIVSVVALGPDRLLSLVDGQGYRCSTDAGATWEPSCPPA